MKFIKNVMANAPKTITTALFFAAMLSLTIDPLTKNIGFRSFDRVFGHATLSGVDASARISNFTMFHVFFLPICFFIGILLCHCFTQKNEEASSHEDALSFLNIVSLCALTQAFIFIVNKYVATQETFHYFANYGIQIALVLILATLLYIKHPFMPFEVFRFALFFSFGITLWINFMLRNNTPESKNFPFGFGIIFLFVTAFMLATFHTIKEKSFARLRLAFLPISFGMFFAGLTLELCNILNQHEIFIKDRLGAAQVTYCVMLVISIFLFVLGGNKFFVRLTESPQLETLSLIGLLISIYYFTVIPPLQIAAGTELFEQANHGMLVNDFLAWGKIPIINSFDGHMLRHSLGSIFYGILNGDILGASYYWGYNVWIIPQAICLFLVYKKVFGNDFALFFMLLAPSINTLNVSIGVIAVLALLHAVQKQTIRGYLLLLFSVVIATIYEAPVGLSYGGGALLVMLTLFAVQMIQEKKITTEFKKFLSASLIFLGIMATLWVTLCLFQSVNPIKRMFEFIGLAQSTNNWAYASIGDNATVLFAMLYSVLPLLVICCLAVLIARLKKNPVHIAATSFLVAYLLNFTRALGRHSLAEGEARTSIVIWTAILGLALFSSNIFPIKKHAAFVLCALIMTTLFNFNAISAANAVANVSLNTANNPKIYYNLTSKKINRVDISAPLSEHEAILDMIDLVIPEGETYVDFTSQTMLYALSGREKPIYINQSLLHLSGEYTQERFIEDVENYNGVCNFALTLNDKYGASLDKISNSYRYYKAYEYLYENFYPICKSSDNFTLWARKNQYETSQITPKIIKEISLETINAEKTNDLEVISTIPLVLQCGSKDPFITFPFDTPIDNKSSLDIEIVYKSNISDMCQLFFDYEGFNEMDSAKTNLPATNHYSSVYFSLPGHPNNSLIKAIRLDPPNDSVFEIKAINILENPSPHFALIDYENKNAHQTENLGQIPYIWGQFDNEKSWENVVVWESKSEGTFPQEVQKTAKYVLLTFDSAIEGSASLVFKDPNGEDVSTFSFSILKGKNRYIIRASTSLFWNNGNIAGFAVKSDSGTNLQDVKFLLGD